MAINQPVTFDFPPHYKEGGIASWTVKLKYKNGNPIDLTDAVVRMQLRTRYTGNLVWEFSSAGDGNSLIEIIDAVNGKIQFPEIKSWDLPASIYEYDLRVMDNTNFVRYYLKGTWAVNQNITTKKD